MQNFFLSTYLGRPADGAGNKAAQRLLDTATPAARRAGIRIIWINWGLTDRDIEGIPPSIRRAFGFEQTLEQRGKKESLPAIGARRVNWAAAEDFLQHKDTVPENRDPIENKKPKRIYQGLGSEMGPVIFEDGEIVNNGRLLMKGTWNAALSTP